MAKLIRVSEKTELMGNDSNEQEESCKKFKYRSMLFTEIRYLAKCIHFFIATFSTWLN